MFLWHIWGCWIRLEQSLSIPSTQILKGTITPLISEIEVLTRGQRNFFSELMGATRLWNQYADKEILPFLGPYDSWSRHLLPDPWGFELFLNFEQRTLSTTYFQFHSWVILRRQKTYWNILFFFILQYFISKLLICPMRIQDLLEHSF